MLTEVADGALPPGAGRKTGRERRPDRFERHGLREEVALPEAAGKPFEIAHLGAGLRAFGDDVEAEGACKVDDRQHDFAALVALPQTRDEGSVDLERVNGETLQ